MKSERCNNMRSLSRTLLRPSPLWDIAKDTSLALSPPRIRGWGARQCVSLIIDQSCDRGRIR